MKPYLPLGKAVASIGTDTRNTMGQFIVALYIAKEYLTKFKYFVYYREKSLLLCLEGKN